MNTNTGEIASLEIFETEHTKEYIDKFIKPIDINNLSPHVREMLEKTGRAQITRNSRCPCGSGKRFKRCCMTHE
jgi:uncharacterized protein YecA (UPF0149 family)